MNKEQKQIIVLVVLLLGIVGALVYFNFDRFKPRSSGGAIIPQATVKLQIGSAESKALFDRQEYKSLEEFGLVPVRPTGVGVDNPFGMGDSEDETQ